jgi:hypothetical protein
MWFGIWGRYLRIHIRNNVGFSAGILKQFIEVRNRVGIGLSYWPARLHSLAELVPWNRFWGSLKVLQFGLRSLQDYWVGTFQPT